MMQRIVDVRCYQIGLHLNEIYIIYVIALKNKSSAEELSYESALSTPLKPSKNSGVTAC